MRRSSESGFASVPAFDAGTADALETQIEAVLAPPEEPLVYTPEEAAKVVRVKTAYWLLSNARAGRIPHTRIGKTICFTRQNLVDLVEQGYCDPKRGGRPARRE